MRGCSFSTFSPDVQSVLSRTIMEKKTKVTHNDYILQRDEKTKKVRWCAATISDRVPTSGESSKPAY